MTADGGSPRLDALSTLLASAQQLARALESEPLIGRVLQAFAALAPDDRETLATALERGVAWRKVNETAAPAHGVHLRVNPNPRLFIRVIDGEAPAIPLSPDPDEVLFGILRGLRRAPIVMADFARAVWEPALTEAMGILTPEEQQACIAFLHLALELLEPLVTRSDPDETR